MKRLLLLLMLITAPVVTWADGLCSGFFISPDGYIATAGHCSGGKDYYVTFAVGQNFATVRAHVIAVAEDDDAMILKIDGWKDPVPYFGTETTITIGEPVTAYGFPEPDKYGYTLKKLKGTITGVNMKQIELTMPVGHGLSGGVVMNNNGKAIGIVVTGEFKSMGFFMGDEPLALQGGATPITVIISMMQINGILGGEGTYDAPEYKVVMIEFSGD